MSKDDYYVVVFKILKYLYQQLKSGKPPEPEMLLPESKNCPINEFYWEFVIISMLEEGLIRGLKKTKGQSGYTNLREQMENVQITIKGIELLCDNRMSDRVDKLIKGALKIG